MSKRTRKQKLKQRKRDAAATVTCWDCHWTGSVRDIVYNGIDDRSECPNCTGTNYGLANSPEPYKSPVTAFNPKSYDDWNAETADLDGYCAGCNWRGRTTALRTDPHTARDICPDCGSDAIDFIKGTSPLGLSTKRVTHLKPKKAKPYKACYHSHKPMPLINGLVIHGGSCLTPVSDKHDIYIGFDAGMRRTKKAMPWEPGHEILYKIMDGTAPENAKNFSKLVEWTADRLEAGDSVHAGCIGGHGRTGLFFAALVAYMGVSDDAIQYVRDNYCHKAVESKTQVKFLEKHYRVLPVSGSKEHSKPDDHYWDQTGEYTTSSVNEIWRKP